jgi:flagellar basal body-associated protein FliL
MAVIILILPIVILALIGMAALAWGVDTRDGATDARPPRGFNIR